MTYSCKLRALEPEDLELVYRIENDAKLWPWSNSNVPVSHYLVHQYLQNQKGNIYEDGELRLVIEHEDRAMGLLDLTDFSPQHLRAEVGIVLLDEYHRRGIGSVALTLLHEYAAETLRLRSLHAIVAVDNQPARDFFLAAGYKESGTLQRWILGNTDAILYQILLER